NRTVYEFDVHGSKKYIVLHDDDKFGRGPHFHGADDSKGSPMLPGKYKQYPGHFPEIKFGFRKGKVKK
ncbi:MAG: HNH/endonuclease VII fold putative polymorphic toxin, partial [Waterburya sp.]